MLYMYLQGASFVPIPLSSVETFDSKGCVSFAQHFTVRLSLLAVNRAFSDPFKRNFRTTFMRTLSTHRHFRRALVVSISSNTNHNPSPPRHSYINIIIPIGPPTILFGPWTRRSTGDGGSNVIIDIKSDTDRCSGH